jgi:SAM-dependent methyltransferase
MTSADTAATTGRYLFDNDTTEAAKQVTLLADILDGHTVDVLGNIDIAADGRCLELGAGAGTIAAWMADELVPSGQVTVIDLNPRHITERDRTTVIGADVTAHDFGTGRYDLIHARLLFMHLPHREQVLHTVAAALRPGGVLVVSDWDTRHLDEMFVRGSAEVAAAFLAFLQALVGLGERGGMDSGWARRIPAVMGDAGLVGVTAQVFNRLWAGGSAGMLLHDCNSRQKQPELLAAGMSLEQLDRLRTAMSDPQVWAYHWPMITAVGVRPGQ